jgi:hypothetical protein
MRLTRIIAISRIPAALTVLMLLNHVCGCAGFRHQFNRPFGYSTCSSRQHLSVRSESASMLRRSNNTEARDNQRINTLFRILHMVKLSSNRTANSSSLNHVSISELYPDIPRSYEYSRLIINNFPDEENAFLKLGNSTL